jgi:general secretion pathway protein D
LIGDDGSIQLDIDQLIEDQIGSIIVNGSPTPQIGKRQVKSYVNVFDNQMIVLGGLQRTTLSNTRDKLGFIREIPILSHLLGNRTRKTERTELLLFIRPHVLKPEDGTADTNKSIETLSNKEQVKQYLQDPGKTAKEGLIERIK